MRVLLGMSGGLDSTYAVKLLRDEGHEVTGALLVFGDHTDTKAAELSAAECGIELRLIDCSADFERFVVTDFINEYSRGRTPNPCTVCNRFVKINQLYNACLEMGFDAFATGHYAGAVKDEGTGRYYIKTAADPKKDQSYMLWRLTQAQLSRFITPLSLMSKEDIRRRARALGLSSAESRESQDICFLPKGVDYAAYIEERIGKQPPGDYIDINGNRIGRHRGLISYTVGQRKGLGTSFGQHMFVVGINPAANTVTLADENHCFASSAQISSLSFQKMAPCEGEFELDVKIRYAARPVRSLVRITGDRATLEFEAPVKTPSPGQSAVFYDGQALMLGGVIESVNY